MQYICPRPAISRRHIAPNSIPANWARTNKSNRGHQMFKIGGMKGRGERHLRGTLQLETTLLLSHSGSCRMWLCHSTECGRN